jgi:hypothetical protein
VTESKFSSAAWLAATLGLALSLAACGGGGGGDGAAGSNADGLAVQTEVLSASLSTVPMQALSTAEAASLAYMREEEKLAQDVYLQLNTLWGSATRVFGNIANSEATHTEWVRQLLARYALSDPAAGLATGVFQAPALADLYRQLVAKGAASLVDGLKVGAAIEEIDMLDLNKGLAETDNQDIRLVYDNLLRGSRNHLRSFVSNLSTQGVTYVPQYMDPAAYQAIVSTPMER